MWPSSSDSKGACIWGICIGVISAKIACIQSVYIMGTYVRDIYASRGTCANNDSFTNFFARGACLQGAFIESTGTEGTSTRGTYSEDACIQVASIEDLYIETIFGGNICDRGASIDNTFAGAADASASIVSCLGMYLQSF